MSEYGTYRDAVYFAYIVYQTDAGRKLGGGGKGIASHIAIKGNGNASLVCIVGNIVLYAAM